MKVEKVEAELDRYVLAETLEKTIHPGAPERLQDKYKIFIVCAMGKDGKDVTTGLDMPTFAQWCAR